MRLNTQILKYLGIIYIVLGFGFSALVYIFPSMFLAGEPLNEVVFKSSVYAFWLIGLLCAGYWLKYKPDDKIVVNYNWAQCVVYVVLFINGAYCLFSTNEMVENGLTMTSSKLRLGLAVIMMSGFFVYVGSQNIIKNISRIDQENAANNL